MPRWLRTWNLIMSTGFTFCGSLSAEVLCSPCQNCKITTNNKLSQFHLSITESLERRIGSLVLSNRYGIGVWREKKKLARHLINKSNWCVWSRKWKTVFFCCIFSLSLSLSLFLALFLSLSLSFSLFLSFSLSQGHACTRSVCKWFLSHIIHFRGESLIATASY